MPAADTNHPDTDPPTPTVRTPTLRIPTLRTPTAVPEAAADSHGVRGVRLRGHPDTGRGVRLPGRLRQKLRGPTTAVPAPRQRRARCACSSVLVKRARSTLPADTGCPDARTPDAACRTPGARTPRRCGHPRLRQGRADLRQRPRWTAGSRAVHHRSRVRPERDRNGRYRPARPPDRQIRSLVLRVDLDGSRRKWPAHVGCLVDPEGSRTIPSDRLDDQRMIKQARQPDEWSQ
jgi:hypothetical protein